MVFSRSGPLLFSSAKLPFLGGTTSSIPFRSGGTKQSHDLPLHYADSKTYDQSHVMRGEVTGLGEGMGKQGCFSNNTQPGTIGTWLLPGETEPGISAQVLGLLWVEQRLRTLGEHLAFILFGPVLCLETFEFIVKI